MAGVEKKPEIMVWRRVKRLPPAMLRAASRGLSYRRKLVGGERGCCDLPFVVRRPRCAWQLSFPENLLKIGAHLA